MLLPKILPAVNIWRIPTLGVAVTVAAATASNLNNAATKGTTPDKKHTYTQL